MTDASVRRAAASCKAVDTSGPRTRVALQQCLHAAQLGRQTALIAAKEGVDPARLNVALMKFVRETLRRIAAGPLKH